MLTDIAWLTLLHRADIVERNAGYDFIGNRPKLKNWQQNLMATGLAGKSVADDFEEVFSDYYLSDKTFLGRDADPESCPTQQACDASSCC